MSRLLTPAAALTFNTATPTPPDALQERIARQRALLKAWQDAVDEAQTRYARDIGPLHDAYCALLAQQVQHLDVLSDLPGLSKVDRASLRDLIAQWASTLAEASRAQALRADMQDIQRRNAEASAPEHSVFEDAFTDEHAEDVSQHLDTTTDAEEAPHGDWDTARNYAERRRAAHHAARLRRKNSQATQPSSAPSLREVYRRVASALHPDREPDPQQRAQKTALMQQANHAYAKQDLMALLDLLGDTGSSLVPYQTLLATQLALLEREVAASAQAFCDRFGVTRSPSLTPEKAVASLKTHAKQLRDAIAWQQAALRAQPQNADGIRRWLRHEKAIQRQQR